MWPEHSDGLGQQPVRWWSFDGRHAYISPPPVVCSPVYLWCFHSLMADWTTLPFTTHLLTWVWGCLDIKHKNRRLRKKGSCAQIRLKAKMILKSRLPSMHLSPFSLSQVIAFILATSVIFVHVISHLIEIKRMNTVMYSGLIALTQWLALCPQCSRFSGKVELAHRPQSQASSYMWVLLVCMNECVYMLNI